MLALPLSRSSSSLMQTGCWRSASAAQSEFSSSSRPTGCSRSSAARSRSSAASSVPPAIACAWPHVPSTVVPISCERWRCTKTSTATCCASIRFVRIEAATRGSTSVRTAPTSKIAIGACPVDLMRQDARPFCDTREARSPPGVQDRLEALSQLQAVGLLGDQLGELGTSGALFTGRTLRGREVANVRTRRERNPASSFNLSRLLRTMCSARSPLAFCGIPPDLASSLSIGGHCTVLKKTSFELAAV
mmetsp:Transcript_33059/g.72653  ORF Transcript_33059/g.72653 Transcript_33059/m.72653 type:complete len:247 (-) Transcript_33059:237-977(-)